MSELQAAPIIDTVVNTGNVADLSWDNIETAAPKLDVEPKVNSSDESIVKSDEPKLESKPEEDHEESSNGVSEDKQEINPELKDDLQLEVKVDGKVEKVSLKDLKSNYSGKVAYDKKFSEVDKQHKTVLKEKNQLQQEVKQINDYVNTFAAKMQQRDSLGAMEYLAQFSGISPAQMRQNLINQLLPEINRLSDLTPEARDLEVQKEEQKFQKSRQEQELAKLRAENSRKESEFANLKLRTEKGISEQEWDDAFTFLDTHLEPGKPITREDVAEYALWKRADDRTSSVLSSFDNGNYLKDRSVRDTLTKIASENPDFSDADLNDILHTAIKGKVEEEVKQVTQKKGVKTNIQPRNEKGQFTYTPTALTSWDF